MATGNTAQPVPSSAGSIAHTDAATSESHSASPVTDKENRVPGLNESVQAFKPWPRVIDEIRRLGPSRPGGMKLFAYLLDTECLQLADQQLRIVVPADDFLKRKVLQQSDSLEMMGAAIGSVTGETWQLRIVDTKEAASIRSHAAKNAASGDAQKSKSDFPHGSHDSALSSHCEASRGPAGASARTHPDPSSGQPSQPSFVATSATAQEHAASGMPQTPSNIQDGDFFHTNPPIPDAPVEEVISTGDESLDKLLLFSRETGIPLEIQEEPQA